MKHCSTSGGCRWTSSQGEMLSLHISGSEFLWTCCSMKKFAFHSNSSPALNTAFFLPTLGRGKKPKKESLCHAFPTGRNSKIGFIYFLTPLNLPKGVASCFSTGTLWMEIFSYEKSHQKKNLSLSSANYQQCSPGGVRRPVKPLPLYWQTLWTEIGRPRGLRWWSHYRLPWSHKLLACQSALPSSCLGWVFSSWHSATLQLLPSTGWY